MCLKAIEAQESYVEARCSAHVCKQQKNTTVGGLTCEAVEKVSSSYTALPDTGCDRFASQVLILVLGSSTLFSPHGNLSFFSELPPSTELRKKKKERAKFLSSSRRLCSSSFFSLLILKFLVEDSSVALSAFLYTCINWTDLPARPASYKVLSGFLSLVVPGTCPLFYACFCRCTAPRRLYRSGRGGWDVSI